MAIQHNIGDEYSYTVDGKTYKFKIVKFVGERIHSIRWIESRKSYTKSITLHKAEWVNKVEEQ